jgi:hypothetical protein
MSVTADKGEYGCPLAVLDVYCCYGIVYESILRQKYVRGFTRFGAGALA